MLPFVERMVRLSDVRDAELRPLAENHATCKESVPMAAVRCPYPGSRQGLSMNGSALQQMTRHFRALLPRMKNPLPRPCASWRDVLTAAARWVCEAPYLVARGAALLPVPVALQYKVGIGVLTLARAQLPGADFPADVDALLCCVETSGRLLNRPFVCAASPAQLRAVLAGLFAPGTVGREPLDEIADLVTEQMILAEALRLWDAQEERLLLLAARRSGKCEGLWPRARAQPLPPPVSASQFLAREGLERLFRGDIAAVVLRLSRRQQRLETRIARRCATAPAKITLAHRSLFPRLHALAWHAALGTAAQRRQHTYLRSVYSSMT
jgi:hypothetical protein